MTMTQPINVECDSVLDCDSLAAVQTGRECNHGCPPSFSKRRQIGKQFRDTTFIQR